MTTKGERTKAAIAERAAGLFNRVGYAAASMSDVMAETGLEKGGIYNHFASKQELALAAFQHSVRVVTGHWSEALEGLVGLPAIMMMIQLARKYSQSPPIYRGVPLPQCGGRERLRRPGPAPSLPGGTRRLGRTDTHPPGSCGASRRAGGARFGRVGGDPGCGDGRYVPPRRCLPFRRTRRPDRLPIGSNGVVHEDIIFFCPQTDRSVGRCRPKEHTST